MQPKEIKIAGWKVEVNMAKDSGEYEAKTKDLMLEFKDVFAFTYKDMKGIPPHMCEHKIELQ